MITKEYVGLARMLLNYGLVITKRRYVMIRANRILVPTDFSDYSEKALDRAVEIAKDSNAKIELLHVIHNDVIQCADTYCLDEKQINEIKDQMHSAAGKQLKDQIKKFANVGGLEIVPVVRQGIPYTEILAEQKEKDIDLVVMSHLGKSRVEKFFLGGVARNVIKGASCSVLLVR
jgi:universal stress protein A